MVASNTVESSDKKPPVLSLQDLTIVEAFDQGATQAKYVTFYQVTREDELYFGQLFKKKKEITLAEYNAALEHVPDSEIYPAVPPDTPLTIAPDDLDDVSAFIKRPGINCYEEMKGSDFIPKGVLEETLIMEQISKTPHPYIIGYLGCRVRRGRITALVLERLDKTLQQHVHEPSFAKLDGEKFAEALESAVAYLHSLGLAHNDINPGNIMVKGGMPVLIDFGSCQPFGGRLQSLGSPGWCEEVFFTSQAKHDMYALRKLREWLEKPE
ncbi:Serine/threonine-protein kinase/endoribonuclease IRE2 [Beauveria bassiana D1-5]|uniref:Serine/threonine-protein kinase/endoribonuclease IRE2 n=1 Tax=Beauveria bassiana D1-5 TaxID=1245745 RepID=A0A0A2VUU9_BEABA|nr:Serine/threonine-protein kinase/endoribonuclease IRE2 [Beauveria bassiana D1-5]